MKLNVKAPITDLDGVAVRQPAKAGATEGDVFTIGEAIIGSLLANIEGDDKKPQESFERFMLAMKLHEAKGEVDITIEDAKCIKDRVGKTYSTLVLGRIWQMLEA